MKKEFESRAGIKITAEEYERVEQAYMGLPDSVDKDKFVKIWLREGGIQSILDGRMATAFQLREKIKELEEEIGSLMSLLHGVNASNSSLEEENRALKEMVETIKGVVAA